MVAPLLFASALYLAFPAGLGPPLDGWDVPEAWDAGEVTQGWDAGDTGTREPVAATPRLRARELVTGGAGVNDPLPLVVVLHGRAAHADGFMRRFFALGVRARVVALEAPRRLPREGGFAWLSQRVADAPPAQVERELIEAADAVALELEALVAGRPTVGQPIVVGYSQGGMVALTLAAERPETVGDVIAAASFLPTELGLVAGSDAGSHVPRVRMVHGRADVVVPYGRARETRDRLRGADWDVELLTVPRGHQLHPRGWGRVLDELRRAVRAQA